MIERPEAVTLAKQVSKTLTGKRIVRAERENSPHKWVFYNREKTEYETLPIGKRIGKVTSLGSQICIELKPGYFQHLGDGGERFALIAPDEKLPKKYHLLWELEDNVRFTVSVAGWGTAKLHDRKQYNDWLKKEQQRLDPVDPSFTYEAFNAMAETYCEACDKPVKAMLTSESPIAGIGNGYLQDILFRAGLHPRKKVRQIRAAQQKKLHTAIRKVLSEAIEQGGRDSEIGLHGNPGRYVCTMDKRAKDTPCPKCNTPIEKINFMGGSCYVCARCQPFD